MDDEGSSEEEDEDDFELDCGDAFPCFATSCAHKARYVWSCDGVRFWGDQFPGERYTCGTLCSCQCKKFCTEPARGHKKDESPPMCFCYFFPVFSCLHHALVLVKWVGYLAAAFVLPLLALLELLWGLTFGLAFQLFQGCLHRPTPGRMWTGVLLSDLCSPESAFTFGHSFPWECAEWGHIANCECSEWMKDEETGIIPPCIFCFFPIFNVFFNVLGLLKWMLYVVAIIALLPLFLVELLLCQGTFASLCTTSNPHECI